ncbi:helix-turn-helix domain-containing protein [Streptomyces sp. C10-9-1]|uniref:helix-turn-helix domain-containing protein n=1 Tax=Streptomyces sp. C10-9-1 TaxID=1859285 RepID=UPI0021126C91|nr:helix-turn-helix transcriptional regulator [Streptomyces sp. C10-9-1]MCQ6554729.1 helix-turn-helix domain-containing protein [Streptomyces sp. C10-9-1]
MSYPTVRRRRLGAELRRLREESGLTLDDVADRTSLPAAKVSRIETARLGIKPGDLATLLELYGVDDEGKRALLHALARDGSRRGWWQTYRDTISPAYADLISLESEAHSVRCYETHLIPGLLQTAAYARATIAAINMTSPHEHVDALTEVRQARQAVLTRREPLELWAIIHEAALRTRVPAGPHVMRDQLQHLVDRAELPHVSIQVLPFSAAPHPGMAGPFTVVRFSDAPGMDVVLLESLTSALYVEDHAEVGRYASAFERLRAAALPVDASSDLIKAIKDKIT